MAEVAQSSGPPLPEGGLDRIYEALVRCQKYLPASALAKLKELFDPNTLLAFVVLLAIWAGFQFVPVAGSIIDVALFALGAYGIGKDLSGVIAAGAQAAQASTDAELEAAAKALAQSMTDSVVDAIALVLGATAFAKLRAVVRGIRGRLLPKRAALESSSPAGESLPSRSTTGTDVVIGAGAGVGLTQAAPVLGQGLSKLQIGLSIGLPVVGLALAIVGGVALSRRSAARKQPWLTR